MKLVYISHPVSGDVQANLSNAGKWIKWASRLQGIVPIAPYFQSVVAFSEHDPDEREEGFQHGLKVLQYCQEMWVCGGVISRGMQREIDAALGWNTPVVYLEEMK